jgi:hypothetical protein
MYLYLNSSGTREKRYTKRIARFEDFLFPHAHIQIWGAMFASEYFSVTKLSIMIIFGYLKVM